MWGTLLAVKSVEPGHAALRLREKQIPSMVMQLYPLNASRRMSVLSRSEILWSPLFLWRDPDRASPYAIQKETERKVMKASSEAERENLRLPFDDL